MSSPEAGTDLEAWQLPQRKAGPPDGPAFLPSRLLSRGYLQETTLEHGSLLTENLDAVTGALHHEDPVFVIDFYRYWPLKRTLTLL